MPPEWAPHRATWLSWPHRESSWPGKFEPVPGVFVEIVKRLVPGEEVHIAVGGEALEDQVRRLLAEAGIASVAVRGPGARPVPRASSGARVFLHDFPTNDAWCRDHGPIFVHREVNGCREEAIVDWDYNAWGGKYPPFEDDDRLPSRIGERFGIRVFHPGIVLEGGSIEVNGRGTLLTTEACLLNPNRNPTLSREAIERYLRDYLGVTQILWLGEGIEGDDTDGHVDDLARFVDPETVVTVVEDDPSDPNHEPLRENLARLRAMRDPAGRPFRVIPLPMPPALYHEGQRLPASYANFYIANEVVLLPAYGAPSDEEARRILQACFPDRQVVPIGSRDLVWGLGSFHCVTQQWPAL
jgi:agmatine deiminase